ncbi:MAG: ATP-binding protein [Bacteroidia bacterium]
MASNKIHILFSIDTQDIYRWLEAGEGEKVDFKHSITSISKIAKAIVSFANHKGGVLLVGVKDNGKPAKINIQEEVYMLEAAIDKCKPQMDFNISEHKIDGRSILCMQIDEGKSKPYLCLDEEKKWTAFVRRDDSNVLANWVWLQVERNNFHKKDIKLEYHGVDERVIKYLKESERLTQRQISKALKINFRKVGNVLVKLVGMGVVHLELSKQGAFYSINV